MLAILVLNTLRDWLIIIIFEKFIWIICYCKRTKQIRKESNIIKNTKKTKEKSKKYKKNKREIKKNKKNKRKIKKIQKKQKKIKKKQKKTKKNQKKNKKKNKKKGQRWHYRSTSCCLGNAEVFSVAAIVSNNLSPFQGSHILPREIYQ